MTNYDESYRNIEHLFGTRPERILVDHAHLLNKNGPILDIGIGQGRNAIFLAENGFSVDGIDPSGSGIEIVSNLAREHAYDIKTYKVGFEDLVQKATSYCRALVFGLIQILPRDSIDLLIDRLDKWLDSEGLVFVTGFTVLDPSYETYSETWDLVGKNSFKSKSGAFRTFLEPGEMPTLFADFNPIHHWEGMGPEHRHGDGPVERHSLVEAVFEKR